eukprot:1152702-Pelagomonas_calceolata.AAC.2
MTARKLLGQDHQPGHHDLSSTHHVQSFGYQWVGLAGGILCFCNLGHHERSLGCSVITVTAHLLFLKQNAGGSGLAAAHRECLGQTQRPDQLHQVWVTSGTSLEGTPGTRPGMTETAPNLNGRWNRRYKCKRPNYLNLLATQSHCNKTVVLGHKDQAKTGGRIPLWHLPIPLLRNGGTCTPSLWLPAHSVRAHTGYLS